MSKRKVIFVADVFVEECQGGAELTSEVIIKNSTFDIEKIKCSLVTLDFIKNNKNTFWIFGNFASLGLEEKVYFLKNEDYSIIEYDYKYCEYRNDDLHNLYHGQCKCEGNFIGKINSLFLFKSKIIWWMSEKQREHYMDKFPFLKKTNNKILSSLFEKETLEKILLLAKNPKNGKWLILNSNSPVKNTNGCKEYAEKNNLLYEMVWGLKYKDMLEKMSTFQGVIFLPSGKDTCPRLTIEAKLLGCELVLNDKVQHAEESWFKDKESIIDYLTGRENIFWEEVQKYV